MKVSLWNRMKAEYVDNLKLAWPIMLSQAGQVTVNFVDNIMIGKLGAAPLAAVSIANALFIVFLVVGLGLSFALTPLVSEALGADNKHLIKDKFKHSLVVNTIYAVISSLMIVLFAPLFHRLNQPEDVVPLAIDYVHIVGFSLIPFMVFQTYRTLAEGLARTKLVFAITVFGNVLNVIFNYVLIFGHFGFPEWGISGAAYGTLLSRIIMALSMFLVFRYSSSGRDLFQGITRRFYKSRFKRILELGIPSALSLLFEVSAFSASAFIIGTLGKEQLAAHQIAINLASITFLLATGFSIGATIRVGRRLGEKSWGRIKPTGFSNILLVTIFMMVCGLIFVLFRNSLPKMYIQDLEIQIIAAGLLIIAALFQIVDGVQVVAIGALRGLQDVKIPMLITFVSYWLIAIPLGYVLAHYCNMHAKGVWIGLWAGLTISAILLTIRFNKISEQIIN